MAFFQLALKARKIERARLIYEDEKFKSIKISEGAKVRYSLRQKIRHKKKRCKRRLKQCLVNLLSCPEDSWFHRKAVLLRTDGTFENYILKSVIGFLGGIFLTYMFFMFFVFQLNFTLSSATLLCSIFGIILTLGLAFSHKIRCLVFLLLPQFFSKRGRQALMAYAFILALTGPAKNTLQNIGVLSESLACGQEQLKHAVRAVMDLIKQPFHALGDAISKVIKTIKSVVKKIKQTLVAIKRMVLSILRVFKSVFEWLGNVVNICNKKLGTPFDRCERVFEGAVLDCKAKLGPIFGGVCNLATIVSAVCYIVKPLDFICMLVSYVADSIVGAVRKKIKKFTRQMKAMFYVKVKFSRSYHFETNQSKSFEDISTGIATEIRSRADRFLAVFDWMGFVTSFFMLFMLLRVIHYRHKWLTNERFDNRYLTDDLRTIDLIRARQDKETVLPLNRRERNRYIPLSSIRLIKMERVKLAKSAIFLFLTTFKLCIHMMADYSLYWILSTIRYHGRFESKVQQPNSVGVYVSGTGYLAELYRSIVKAFLPSIDETAIDSIPCLPDPIPPDMDRYTQILSLIVFCWIMAIFEPYGLRLRSIVMCYYHPDRAKQRATWLYNHIIRSRGNFLKYARRQLRRKYGVIDGEGIEHVSLRDRLEATCPLLRKIFPRKEKACLLCGTPERGEKSHVKCPTPGCVGIFCVQCFADLQNLCTICRSPMEYGDLSDMSEEKDSSEDQLPGKPTPKPIKEKGKKKEKKVKTKKKDAEAREEEITEKDEAEQTDKGFEEPDKISTDSTYSYTYQDEPPAQHQVVQTRIPFKDVEAQKVKDDVTIQIFNEPLERDDSSSTEGPTSCFVVRAHRKIRGKLRSKRRAVQPDGSSSSTSVAETESMPSEEVDEEEVIHIEVDGGSRENLMECRETQTRRHSRVARIIAALSRISWLGRGGGKDGKSRSLRRRRPSLMDRIVCMLRRKRFSPTQTYRRIRRKNVSSSSSLSLSCEEEDEDRALLPRDREESTGKIMEDDGVDSCLCVNDNENNIYSKSYESHARRRRTSKDTEMRSPKQENIDLKYPHEKKFPTKDLPRSYFEPLSERTSYCEVDETEDSRSPKFVRQVDDINALSDARTSSDSRKTDTWNITRHDGEHVSYGGETNVETSTDRNEDSARMSTIEERTDEISETEKTEDTSRTENTWKSTREIVDSSPSVATSTENTSSPSARGKWSTNKSSTSSPGERRFVERSRKIGRVSKKAPASESLSGNEEEKSGERPEEVQVPTDKISAGKKEVEPGKQRTLVGAKKEGPDKKGRVSKIEEDQAGTVDDGKMKVDKATDVKDQSRGTQTKFRRHREEEKEEDRRHKETETSTLWETDKSTSESPRRRRRRSKNHRRSKRSKRSPSDLSTEDDPYSKKRRKRYRNDRHDSKKQDCRESKDEPTCVKCRKSRRVCFCVTEKEYPEKAEEWPCKQKSRSPRYECARHHEHHESCGRCSQRHSHSCREQQPRFSLAECRQKALQILGRHRCSAGADRIQPKRFDGTRMKKYLPVYQRPEVIKELKEHDRMKLIRERETRRRNQTRRDFVAKFEDTSDASVVCHSPDSVRLLSEEEETLPYQETEAFKKVVCEFQRKTFPKRSENVEPLISVSQRADRTKEVRRLFPPEETGQRTKDDEAEEESSSVEDTTDNNEITE